VTTWASPLASSGSLDHLEPGIVASVPDGVLEGSWLGGGGVRGFALRALPILCFLALLPLGLGCLPSLLSTGTRLWVAVPASSPLVSMSTPLALNLDFFVEVTLLAGAGRGLMNLPCGGHGGGDGLDLVEDVGAGLLDFVCVVRFLPTRAGYKASCLDDSPSWLLDGGLVVEEPLQ